MRSCYGARPTNDCFTCEDVVKAHEYLEWPYRKSDFEQCKGQSDDDERNSNTNTVTIDISNVDTSIPDTTSISNGESSSSGNVPSNTNTVTIDTTNVDIDTSIPDTTSITNGESSGNVPSNTDLDVLPPLPAVPPPKPGVLPKSTDELFTIQVLLFS
eukprot:tig00021494_g21917.t1